MEISLEQVQEEPFSWHEKVAVSAAALERSEVVDLGEVEWRGRVAYVEGGYLLSAHLDYDQTVACTRCLEPVSAPVSAGLDLLLIVDPQASTAGEHELEERELGVLVLREEKVDTQPILLEQLQLHVPMKPLCGEECRGLCQSCGADRNERACSCETQTTDPRWAALEGLRDRLEEPG